MIDARANQSVFALSTPLCNAESLDFHEESPLGYQARHSPANLRLNIDAPHTIVTVWH